MSNYSQSLIEDYKQTIERLQKECTEKTNAIIALGEQLKVKEQECERLKEELKFLENNDDLLISNLQILWGKQIANEQGDCKNIDYLLPRTKEIYHKITEIERTLKDVAFAQSVKLGKTKPLGDTGSPRSYKRWEKRERQLLEREFLK